MHICLHLDDVIMHKMPMPRAVVLNLLSLRTSKLSKQILRTSGLSKSTQNVITTKIRNSK